MKIAGVILIIAGIRLILIESVGGYGVMEQSYHGFGIGFIGFGVFCFALDNYLRNMKSDK